MPKVRSQVRKELTEAVRGRYRTATRVEKSKILDEFVALTGLHRKHAVRVLNRPAGTANPRRASTRALVYDEAVAQALTILWEASDRICGKRLAPLLPVLLPALERHGHLGLDPTVREKLLQISPATIDRLLAPKRNGGVRRQARTAPGVRKQIPVRTFADWEDVGPGHMEVDLVAHCGGSIAGSLVHTLTATDVASGWTECVSLVARNSSLVVEAIEGLRVRLPFRLKSIDTDNGSEFINDVLLSYTTSQGLEFTRSRPYRKNDQAWVEQKNGAVVRRLVGYGRLEGLAAAQALARLYDSSRLFVNFFQPSFKLLDKRREGARVKKRYLRPATPCARLLDSGDVDESTKERLRAIAVTCDPLRLLDEIRGVQGHLAGLARGEHAHAPAHRDADLQTFLDGLATAWQAGEVRPTHQASPKPGRHWRTRADPFVLAWPAVVLWLEAEPGSTAKELLGRLQVEHPDQYPDRLLRTLQRRVKAWRKAGARRLVLGDRNATSTGAIPGEAAGSIVH
jgi:hypothetical protein